MMAPKNHRKTDKIDLKDLEDIDLEMDEEGLENHEAAADQHESSRHKGFDFVDENPDNLKLTKVARGNRKTNINHRNMSNNSFS